MTTQKITREQVIELAKHMPIQKLVRWYEYGLFIQTRPLTMPTIEAISDDETELSEEFEAWEAASDEDWIKLENMLTEEANGAR
jgi:hypothetical protein